MTEFGENQDPYIGFRETVRQLMEEQGLSQNAVATAMGMDTSHLNRILRGMRNPPSREKVVALAQVLGMNKETTDNLLVQAGYAPIELSSIVESSSSKEYRRVVSLEARKLIDQIGQEITSLIDNPSLKLLKEKF